MLKDVKQLIEACWYNDLCYRPTMEMVVSRLHDFHRTASRMSQFESDIRNILENHKLSKYGYFLIELTHIAISLHILKLIFYERFSNFSMLLLFFFIFLIFSSETSL